MNELAEDTTPQLSPPKDTNSILNDKIINDKINNEEFNNDFNKDFNEENRTPKSITSSIENYSPIVPSIAHIEKYTNNITKPGTEVIETKNNLSQSQLVISEDKKDSDEEIFDDDSDSDNNKIIINNSNSINKDNQIPTTKSISSIKTFSSDEDGLNDNGENINNNIITEDNDLFEHFNGSTKDLASPSHKRAIDLNYNNSISSPLQMGKIRNYNNNNNNKYNNSNQINNFDDDDSYKQENNDLKNDRRYKNLSRNITPFNPKDGYSDRAMISRIQDLENQTNELDTKYYKLEREIVYVDKMLDELNYSKFEIENKQPVEIRKLLYARGKLQERLQDCNKKRYDLGVTLSKLRRSLYGDNSGDMTEYFARKVSN